jgi:circadian clock protein KaiB
VNDDAAPDASPAGPSAASTQMRERGGRLRLYIARSTPNSMRAEHNLLAALKALSDAGHAIELEIIDVFTHPKRAVTDRVIVTPTLIGLKDNERTVIMGDLSDGIQLKLFLERLA